MSDTTAREITVLDRLITAAIAIAALLPSKALPAETFYKVIDAVTEYTGHTPTGDKAYLAVHEAFNAARETSLGAQNSQALDSAEIRLQEAIKEQRGKALDRLIKTAITPVALRHRSDPIQSVDYDSVLRQVEKYADQDVPSEGVSPSYAERVSNVNKVFEEAKRTESGANNAEALDRTMTHLNRILERREEQVAQSFASK